MANKEFQVRHGLVVNNSVLVANTVTGNVGIGTSNPAYTLDVFGTINAANVLMNGGAIAANLAPAFNTANAAFGVANGAFAQSNNEYTRLSAAFVVANAAYDSANNVAPQVSPAFNTANAAFTVANAAYGNANSLSVSANAYAGAMVNSANAYATATYYPKTGGTITGDVSIVGDLTVSGNNYIVEAETLRISDPLMYLAGNNYSSDVVDIGFIANYVNTGGANVHTGLYREHETKEYYLFQGYDQEPINNHIGALSNNMTLSVLNSDLRTSNLNLGGANAIVWIKSGYDTTNSSFNVANAAFDKANSGGANVAQTAPSSPANGQLWWSTTSARLYIYYTDANSSQWVEASPSSATIDGTIITGYINPVYDIANAAFTVANSAFAYQNSDYSMSNAAYTVANAAFGKANAALANTSGVYFNGNLYFPSGNVGIGTTSSLAKLDVVTNLSNYTSTLGSIDSATVRILNNSVAGLGISSKLNFNIANIGSTVLSGYYATFNGSNDIGTGLIIGTQTNAAGGTVERMRIDQAGNVGIGNTAPKLKLEVAGNMSVDAFVENSANITTSYTITAGRNAMTAGPITVNSGVTVEVPSGSTWTVV